MGCNIEINESMINDTDGRFTDDVRRMAKNSYKFCGLSNRTKNIGVNEIDGAVNFAVTCKKHSQKTHNIAVKKNARRSAYAAGAVTKKVRPDLEVGRQSSC